MAYRATEKRLLTAEEFQRLPDDGSRMELVAGRVVREPPPGFEHGHRSARLTSLLDAFVRPRKLGRILGETGFILAEEPWTVRAPDVAFVSAERLPREPLTGYFPGPPDLAVEIVSPSNSAADIQAKVREYLRAGARLVWVVYPDTRTVAVHDSLDAAHFVDDTGALAGGEVLPGLDIPVAEVFD